MFLVTITHAPLLHHLPECGGKQFHLASGQILTLVTDNFLSTAVTESHRFSVIESPSVSSPDLDQLIFAEVDIDAHDNDVHLFRSPMSGRPIYYHISPGGELYCSTHISMLRKACVPIKENRDALPEFFVYRYVMPPQTLYRDIRQVQLGSHVYFRFRDGKHQLFKIEGYQPPLARNGTTSTYISDVVDRTRCILRDSLRPLKKSSARIAFLLSGGLDSSILFKICQIDFRLDSTYSTGYPLKNGEANVERHYASSAAESFGTKHFHCQVSVNDYLYGLLQAIAAAEEPVHHIQSVLLYLLFRKGLPASKDIVISGEAADSIFGLPLHNQLFFTDKAIFKIFSLSPLSQLVHFLGPVSNKTASLAGAIEKGMRRKLPFSNPDNIVWSLGAHGSRDWTARHFNVTNEDIIRGRYDSIKAFDQRSLYDIVSLLNLLGGAAASTSIWSKLGEEQNKVLFYPYASGPLLDYVYQIPWEIKLDRPKNILRHMGTLLEIPKFILDRPKSAFGIEPEHWAVEGGWFEPLIPIAEKLFSQRDICDLQSTNSQKAAILWNLLNYSIWKRVVVDNEPVTALLDELSESISRLGS